MNIELYDGPALGKRFIVDEKTFEFKVAIPFKFNISSLLEKVKPNFNVAIYRAWKTFVYYNSNEQKIVHLFKFNRYEN